MKDFEFLSLDFCRHSSQAFPCPDDESGHLICPCFPDVADKSFIHNKFINHSPALFSDKFGTVKGMVCSFNLTGSTPVHSQPCQCQCPSPHPIFAKAEENCQRFSS